jgi:arginine repressor
MSWAWSALRKATRCLTATLRLSLFPVSRAWCVNSCAKCAQNLLVIKTTSGSAQPVALAIDAEGWDEIVGTVAGDDTVLIITRDNKNARKLQTRLEEMRA